MSVRNNERWPNCWAVKKPKGHVLWLVSGIGSDSPCVSSLPQEALSEVQTVVVNCMTLRSSHSIFPLLAQQLGGGTGAGGHSSSALQKLLTSNGPTV